MQQKMDEIRTFVADSHVLHENGGPSASPALQQPVVQSNCKKPDSEGKAGGRQLEALRLDSVCSKHKSAVTTGGEYERMRCREAHECSDKTQGIRLLCMDKLKEAEHTHFPGCIQNPA